LGDPPEKPPGGSFPPGDGSPPKLATLTDLGLPQGLGQFREKFPRLAIRVYSSGIPCVFFEVKFCGPHLFPKWFPYLKIPLPWDFGSNLNGLN